MRAVVLFCLLLEAFGQFNSWNGPDATSVATDPDLSSVCLGDHASCGCCLMKKQMKRSEEFFDTVFAEMHKELTSAKTSLDGIRASRSAFSVALSNDGPFACSGPFAADTPVVYKHALVNLGNGYSAQTGVFTAPLSGVYSLTVTVYAKFAPGTNAATCADLQVNGNVAASLSEPRGQDDEDSASVVVAMKLKAGDTVAVSLLKGCSGLR
uniref:C1q domain-containing protein n=1 Tax=Scophthalmus maximus TaxID=52904 RepID=A0A8D3E665_SCOMX